MKQKFLLRTIILLMTTTLIFTNCKKEEKEEEEVNCGFLTSDFKMTLNGKESTLSIAQLVLSGGGLDEIGSMQIGLIEGECTQLTTLNITYQLTQAGKINGTFDIKDPFDAEAGDAFVSIITQKISPISQSLEDVVSGKIIVTDKSNKKYTINMDAKLLSGKAITLKGDVQF